MYCVSHYDKKQVFAHMDELGLMLDRKDFATNGYQVDEHKHPRSAFKAARRKGKAIVPSKEEEEDEAQKDKDCIGVGTLQGVEDDNVVNLTDNNDYVLVGRDDPSLSGAQLTSLVAIVEALVRRRNVIALRTPIVNVADP